jgi:hypothetical protein
VDKVCLSLDTRCQKFKGRPVTPDFIAEAFV